MLRAKYRCSGGVSTQTREMKNEVGYVASFGMGTGMGMGGLGPLKQYKSEVEKNLLDLGYHKCLELWATDRWELISNGLQVATIIEV